MSEGPFTSLNMAVSVGDAPENVEENAARAARWLGVRRDRLLYLSQVHGVEAVTLSPHDSPAEVVQQRGDVTVTGREGIACGVRSADCGTVLLGDPETGAVAAIHAGWRGTVLGVVSAGVRALSGLAGPSSRFVAAVGPHIDRCCFEVGDDVAAELAGCSSWGERAVSRAPNEKPHVDLYAILLAQLVDAGLPREAIDRVPGCTVCNPDTFFSFRRDGQRSGRLLSAIVSRAPISRTP